VISNVFPYGAVGLSDERTGKAFLVDRQQLKYYHEDMSESVEE